MTYRGYSLTAHKFGIEIKNLETGDHCGYSETLNQAKSVIDEIWDIRLAGKFRAS